MKNMVMMAIGMLIGGILMAIKIYFEDKKKKED